METGSRKFSPVIEGAVRVVLLTEKSREHANSRKVSSVHDVVKDKRAMREEILSITCYRKWVNSPGEANFYTERYTKSMQYWGRVLNKMKSEGEEAIREHAYRARPPRENRARKRKSQ